MRLGPVFLIALMLWLSFACYAQTCPGSLPSGMDCVASGASKDITAFSTCAKITNSHASGKAIMTPINSSGEWSTFRSNLPAGVTSSACGTLVQLSEFTGFESGTNMETYNAGTITCSVAATGNCSMQGGASVTNVAGNQDYLFGASVNTSVRIMSSTTTAVGLIDYGSNTNKAEFQWNTNGTTALVGTGAPTITGPTIPRDGTWHYVNVSIDPSIGGLRRLWVDGVSYGTSTLTAAQVVDYMKVGGTGVYFDDVVFGWGFGPAGDLHVISRQGGSGTPQFDAFTKTGGATASAVLSNMPYTTGSFVSSSAASVSQTMPVASFSPTISATSLVHGCKTGLVGLRGSGAAVTVSMIRYYNSATANDGGITLTTSAGYAQSLPYTATLSDINSMEIGVSRGAGTSQATTVYDMWMSCVYTP